MDTRENELFTAHLLSAVREAEALDYRPNRFKSMLNADGGFATVNKILASGRPSEGFVRLLELNRIDLTCEAIIVESRWREFFDPKILANAEALLRGVNYSFSRYAQADLEVQTKRADSKGDTPEDALAEVSRNRKCFIESRGATCRNWTWSWSFINEAEKMIIFGAWDAQDGGGKVRILSKEWEISRRGRRQPGYGQAIEHIRLIERSGYTLFTFPMTYSEVEEEGDVGPAKIVGFVPKLTRKSIVRVGDSWYASDEGPVATFVDEQSAGELVEGALKTITVNAYERNSVARARCLAHYGYACIVCGFDFAAVYGELGKGYIHVHHVVPLSDIRGAYVVDPVKDLVPVCPNCHAMIHATRPCLEIGQLRTHVKRDRTD